MINVVLILIIIYCIYFCIKTFLSSNCSTCVYKHRCWNKSDDKYCKLHKCKHYQRKY